MYQHDLKKVLGATVALASLLAFSGTAAHAAIVQFATDGSQTPASTPGLGPTDTTATYSTGDSNGFVTAPYTPGGASGATFVTTATNADPIFEAFDNSVANGTPVDFPVDTNLILSFDGKDTHNPTGPVEIDFATPVAAFGMFIQDGNLDNYTFTDNVFDTSGTLLNTFTSGSFENINSNNGQGTAAYVGAYSTSGAVIGKVVISTLSDTNTSTFTGGSSNFYSGPLTTAGAPVPEASTSISFGLGTLLFGGMFLMSAKRKAKQSLQASN